MRSRVEDLQAQLDKALKECARLREENQRLRILLGMSLEKDAENKLFIDSRSSNPTPETELVTKQSSTKQKIGFVSQSVPW
ncbi:hypothetical protein EFBL_2712 [Effusibacillus lacus]|uniref:Uncharacterized protein n=1 Tax=Effusibacillus lacus TaxID=1348429 RepID=A0A292YE43_9BACL|nr:hypothetical protein EFBL_2712 [Effusibacillus lacus]